MNPRSRLFPPHSEKLLLCSGCCAGGAPGGAPWPQGPSSEPVQQVEALIEDEETPQWCWL